jgi:hypothetical protein
MRTIILVAACLVAIVAVPAAAQTVVTNPTTVYFLASADHSAFSLDGTTPLVTKYELRVTLATDTVVITVLDLGKPVPDAQNTITAINPVWWAALTPKTRFVARVAAIGPTGEGVSDPSGPFGNVGPPAKPGVPTPKK